eukprot:scaffold85_cov145-Alexandrium_tamarense.AAC.29
MTLLRDKGTGNVGEIFGVIILTFGGSTEFRGALPSQKRHDVEYLQLLARRHRTTDNCDESW